MEESIEAYCQAEGASVIAAELYRTYQAWVAAAGKSEGERLSRRRLALAMIRQGFRPAKASGDLRVWRGLRGRTMADATPLSYSFRHS